MVKHLTKIFPFILILTHVFFVCGAPISSDEQESAEILKTLNKFYSAYHSKDIAEWKTFWHDNSPVAFEREKKFLSWNLPAQPEMITSITIEKGWDKTFATVEIAFVQTRRHLGLIKEADSWKIWHESSSENFLLAEQTIKRGFLEKDLPVLADSELTSALCWKGYISYERKEFNDSIKTLSVVQKVAQQNGDSVSAISALIITGHDHLELGNYQEALQTYKKALQISESANFEIGTIRALSGIGNAANFLGQYFESRNAQEKRLELLRKTNNTRRISITLKNLGNTYFYLGEFDKALKAYEESEQLGFQDIGLMLNTGAVLAELGKFSEAEKKLQQGLLAARERNDSAEIGHALNGLGQVALKRNQYQEACSFFQQGVREGIDLKKDEQAKLLLNQGYASFKLQDYQAAVNLIEKAIQTAKETESPEPIWFGSYILGKILKIQNKPQQARQSFEQSVNFIEVWLQKNNYADGLESFFQDKVEPYRELISLLSDAGENDHALEYAELSKAKTLLKATKGINQNIDTAAPKFSLAQADTLLEDEETALLEYVVTEDATYLFLIVKSSEGNTPPQLIVKKVLLNRQQLENLINSFRNKLAAENYDFADQAQEIYRRLIQPVEDKLANKKKLVIVPDGVIWGVPFQALKAGSEKFLWEQFSITYARSLTSLFAKARKNKSQASEKPTLLGVANPATQSADLIPFAEESVREIAPFYGLPQTRIYTGKAATEKQIKAVISNYDIVHFAAHGYLDNQSPMSSYLQLTTNDFSENGKLEANEIQSLKLKADLVILAGCETGRGKFLDGEGVIGLAWALQKAGAPTVIVSQWKVKDKNTKSLMIEFHRLWRQHFAGNHRLSVSEALRLAALSIQKQRPHPIYWAGFAVMGNGF